MTRPSANDELLQEKEKLEGFVSKRQKISETIDGRTSIKYYIHKYAFIVGVITLVISRIILKIK